MSFYLMYGDRDFTLPLPFDAATEDSFAQLIFQSDPDSPTRVELSRRIVDTLTAMIENNVVPPTEKQIKYAIAIARHLSLQLPPEVLQFKEAMTAFLSAHAEAYRRAKTEERK